MVRALNQALSVAIGDPEVKAPNREAGRHRAADDGGELHHGILVQVFTFHGGVRGAEGHGLGTDLLEATGRTDRLVIQTVASLFLVSLGPLGVHWCWESRASACELGRISASNQACRHQQTCYKFIYRNVHRSDSSN